jgi:ABC-type nitrate/sulfonate/bicarbonate transport system substrate-binding protein
MNDASRSAVCAIVVLLAACSPATPGQPQAGPPATSGAASAGPTSVTVGQAVLTVGGVPIYVAIENGYYAEQNLTFNLTQLQSGSTATQAIASGSIDFVNAGSFDVATAVAKGVPLQAFVTFSGLAIETCLSTELAQSHHLTSTSSAEDVMSAMNGRAMGITGPNSAPDLVLRYMAHARLVSVDVSRALKCPGVVTAYLPLEQRVSSPPCRTLPG